MEIRPLTPDDVDSYLTIWRRALTDHPSAYGASVEDPDMFSPELARQRIAHSMPYNPIFGVFVEGQQVGLSSLFFPANRAKIRHRAQVHQVYVAAELRGRGIAKAMMDVVIVYAKTIPDVEEVHLAVTIGNEAARRLYVSGGFVPHMIDARYFKINGVYYDLEWMYLRLNSSENLTNR